MAESDFFEEISSVNHIILFLCRFSDGKVYDRYGQHVKHYPEVPAVLKRLKSEGYLLGVASRTGEVRGANQLIANFGWEKYFSFKEIYPGRKTKHFNKCVFYSQNYLLFFVLIV